MDKNSKFEYMQTIESYMEEYMVYELFENMLQQLLVHKPAKPLDFMINQLSIVEPGKSLIVVF
jgi:hypothetical protein